MGWRLRFPRNQKNEIALKKPRAPINQTAQMPPVPPSFGGTGNQHTQHSNASSPLIDSTSAPDTNVPVFDQWAHAAQRNYPGPMAPDAPLLRANWDPRAWDVSAVKISKELKPINGMDSAYRTWSNRIEDRFAEKNPDWLLIFNAIEKHKEAIGRELLRTINILGDGYVLDIDFRWVSNALWTFIGKHLVDSIYSNRNTLSGGGNHGFELWRSLFIQHEGGADQVELGEMRSLRIFPQCDRVDNLQLWIGNWQEIKSL